MNPLLHALPFDPHGDSVNNRVTSELHDLNRQARSPYRVIVLEKGHFYKKDLVVREATGRELVLDEDYQLTGMSGEAAHITGQIACSVIVIINPKVKALISVDAQMVGGKFIQVDTAIGQMAAGVINNTRSVWWKNIEGRPDAFTPNGHLHALWEIYGFDEWIAQLHRMVEAILLKSRLAYEGLNLDQTHEYELLQDALDKIHNRFLAHLNNRNNPHKVTATQIGLEQLANYGIATEAEARAIGETITNKYMTVLRTTQHIDSNFVRALNDHIANMNNPHKVTFTQLSTLSSLQIVALMGRLLGLHETAVATARLNGYLYSELYTISRQNLDTSYLAIQRMSLDRLGSGGRDRTYVLRGDNTWVSLQSIFAAYAKRPPSILYMSGIQARPGAVEGIDKGLPEGYGDSSAFAMANINAIYGNVATYPVGTIVICRQNAYQNNGTGNGGFYTTPYGVLFTAVRTAGGWVN
jgi:hypothetical protein